MHPATFFQMAARLLPVQCLLCKAPVAGRPLCLDCEKVLPWNSPHCQRCALPLVRNQNDCERCSAAPPLFQQAFCALQYSNPCNLLLNRFKHDGRLECGRLLANLLADRLLHQRQQTLAPWPQAIVAVPLHWRRLRQRGFDQSLQIARVLAKRLSLPVIDVIARKRETVSQQNLTRIERQHNLQGAFVIQRAIPFRHVALVDDVLTTGSTANEISQLLFQHGVQTVQLWAIARTPESPKQTNPLAGIR